MPVGTPYIPEEITVHLGRPNQDAQNVTVSFPDYIKNVASSEIYPSWPETALRANIYAIITFALNRVYTEWYRSRGYDFDITSSTQYDQSFQQGRDIFGNISDIVDDIFNDYVVRQGSIAPYFTQFCNGTTVTCDGLSQWGTVTLANQGYTPYQMLQYYYGNDINIVENAPVREEVASYQGTPLRFGIADNDVRTIQLELNRIADNYPAIPKVSNTNGYFDRSTEEAVRAFQRVFNLTDDGIVGKATWYKIKFIYNSVRRLGELSSEAITLAEVSPVFPAVLQEGSRGRNVRELQYYINVVAYFNNAIPSIPIDGIFGPQTTAAVRAFQQFYGLPVDGIVGEQTWNTLQDVYQGIRASLSEGYQGQRAKIFPGELLLEGSEGQNVRDLQTYLSLIGKTYTSLPEIPITGYYGTQTASAVRAFQKAFGIEETGVVGAATWSAIVNEYDQITLSGLRDNN